MRRALLLLALVVVPAAFVLFPGFRRFLVSRARLLLLVVAGALVLAAGFRLFLPPGNLPPLSPGERAATAAAFLLLASSFVLVLLDGRRG